MTPRKPARKMTVATAREFTNIARALLDAANGKPEALAIQRDKNGEIIAFKRRGLTVLEVNGWENVWVISRKIKDKA